MLIECFCEDIGIAPSDVSVALRHAKDEKAEKLEEVRANIIRAFDISSC